MNDSRGRFLASRNKMLVALRKRTCLGASLEFICHNPGTWDL